MISAGVSLFARIEEQPLVCPRCRSSSRVGRGLCLSCLLSHGLESGGDSPESLENVLDEIKVSDADWHLGNYQILEEIGRGGMGVIYRARQRHSHRIDALKQILNYHADSSETLERFRREAEAAASLDHPNILPIYEVGESEEGLPFFSMKFAAGGSFVDAAAALRADPRRCVALMAKVARAVHYAHLRGILHRDLKPGNIMLDGRGEPLVSDFGLAKWLDTRTDLTRTLTVFGTPGYIAPEQANGLAATLTPAADVYSLGAILFDLFTGHPPFLGEHALAVIQQAAEKPAPKLRSVTPALDRDLETICARCLERDSQARYRTAGELAIDLEHWLEGRPIVARPVSLPVRLWRWAKRNPKLAAAGAVWLCSMVAVTAFFIFSHPFSSLNGSPPVLEKSIAVLPFDNLGDKENAYFTEGMQDEVLNGLAKVADLKVISRTSVMHYAPSPKRNSREISRSLGVAYLLEGSVLRDSNRVRVLARLIDARNDTQVWAEKYERDLADVFAIQTEIAKKIADRLQAKLSPREKRALERAPTDNITAFDFYTRALNLLTTRTTRANLLKAVGLLNEAISHDPLFFKAYCQLANANDLLYFYGYDHTPARLASAEAAIQSAFRLHPEAGEAHLARAQNLYHGYLDYDAALAELEIARRFLPNDPRVFELQGYIERRRGQWEQSTKNIERSLDLDPHNFATLQQIAVSYGVLRRYAEEAAVLDRALAIEPNDIDTKITRAFVEFHWKADTKPLHQALDSARASVPNALSAIAGDWFSCSLAERDAVAARNALNALGDAPLTDYAVHLNHPLLEGMISRMTNDSAKARVAFMAAKAEQEKTLQAEPNYGPPLCALGLIDAALGRTEEALREGRRAVELVPPSKDAVVAPEMVMYLAIIAGWVGDKELACQQLAVAVRPPSMVSYGQLKLLPVWDPLRGDPRFEQIVASLAPK